MRRKRERGFTIIELLIGMAIVALIAPSLGSATYQMMTVPDRSSSTLNASRYISDAAEQIAKDANQSDSCTPVEVGELGYGEYYAAFVFSCTDTETHVVNYKWDSVNYDLVREETTIESIGGSETETTDSTILINGGILAYEDVSFTLVDDYVEVYIKVTADDGGDGETKEMTFQVALMSTSDGWGFRIPIDLNNSTGGALTDYQVLVNLGADFNFDLTHPYGNGNDIRFYRPVNASEEVELSYWMEEWSCSEQGASALTAYELPIEVTGGVSELYNYPIKVEITNVDLGVNSEPILDHIASVSGDDIRFYDSQPDVPYATDGLSYWIEEFTASKLTVWVKVASLPTGTPPTGGLTLYMYYGNSAAPPVADGAATFELFEDMETSPSGTLISNATYVGADEWVRLTQAIDYRHGELEYTFDPGDGFVAEFEFYTTNDDSGGADAVYLFAYDTSTPDREDQGCGGYHFVYDEYDDQVQLYWNGTQIAYAAESGIATNSWHDAKIVHSGTNTKMYFDDVLKIDYTDTERTKSGTLFGWGARTGGVHAEHRVRNLRVRDAAAIEPTVSLGTENNNAPINSAKIWVKVDTIPAGQSVIYMYYGNEEAFGKSSLEDTFGDGNFSDTFSDETKIDMGDSVNVTVSGGQAEIGGADVFTQPSFENSGWDFYDNDADLNGGYSTTWASDGTYSAKVWMDTLGYVDSDDYSEVRQTIDLTGVSTITFDARLWADSSDEHVARIFINEADAGLWTQALPTETGIYNNISVDVSGITGSCLFSFRVTSVWTNDEYFAYFDNIRVETSEASLVSVLSPDDGVKRFAVGKELSWNGIQPAGTVIKYYVQYSNDGGSSWQLLPDTVLPGNSAGFSNDASDVSPVDMSGVTPYYGQIRLMADMSTTNPGVVPWVENWDMTFYERNNVAVADLEGDAYVPEEAVTYTGSGADVPQDASVFDSLTGIGDSLLGWLWSEDSRRIFSGSILSKPQHMFKIHIDEDPADIESMELTWTGSGGLFPAIATMQIWNKTNEDWDDVTALRLPSFSRETSVTALVEGNYEDYVDDGDIYLTVYKHSIMAFKLYTDYIGLSITTTGGGGSLVVSDGTPESRGD